MQGRLTFQKSRKPCTLANCSNRELFLHLLNFLGMKREDCLIVGGVSTSERWIRPFVPTTKRLASPSGRMQLCGKDADPNIHIYKEAKAEYAKLQRGIRRRCSVPIRLRMCRSLISVAERRESLCQGCF